MLKFYSYHGVPGWSDFYVQFEEIFAELPSNADILELGCGFGRGTWTMLEFMRPSMSLYVLDFFEMTTYILWDDFLKSGSELTLTDEEILAFEEMLLVKNHQEVFRYNIMQHPRSPQLKDIYAMTSQTYMSENKRNNYDLVFIDGTHTYDVLSTELEFFKDCTLLTGHDYDNPDHPDVRAAVQDFMTKHKDRSLQIYEDQEIFVIRKT